MGQVLIISVEENEMILFGFEKVWESLDLFYCSKAIQALVLNGVL